jgi:hypothetical protein
MKIVGLSVRSDTFNPGGDMPDNQQPSTVIIFVMATIVAVLATLQFATGHRPVVGIVLLVIAAALLSLGGYHVTRSR